MKTKMTRRDARRHAFNLIFQLPFHIGFNTEVLAETKATYFEFLADNDEENLSARPTGKYAEYIDRAVWGVFDRQNEIDQVISNFLREWTIDRINKVDLALMRLSVYEMLCEEDVPLGVSVNEAVELAKEYGADESPSFINGVLGNVSREIKAKRENL